MARPLTHSCNFFPFDINIFEDDKIQLIESEYGIKGSYVYIRLLSKIYSNSFYYKWGKDESLLFAKRVGNDITGSLVNEIVSGLVRRSLFDEGVLNSFGVLTSKGIQERYFQVIKKESKITLSEQEISYLLTDVPSNFYPKTCPKKQPEQLMLINRELMEVNPPITPINLGLMPQGKGKDKDKIKDKDKERVKGEENDTPALDLDFFILYFKNAGYKETEAKQFFSYYEKTNWKTKEGLDIINRTAAADSWILRITQYAIKSGMSPPLPTKKNKESPVNEFVEVEKWTMLMNEAMRKNKEFFLSMADVKPVFYDSDLLKLKTRPSVFNLLKTEYLSDFQELFAKYFENTKIEFVN